MSLDPEYVVVDRRSRRKKIVREHDCRSKPSEKYHIGRNVLKSLLICDDPYMSMGISTLLQANDTQVTETVSISEAIIMTSVSAEYAVIICHLPKDLGGMMNMLRFLADKCFIQRRSVVLLTVAPVLWVRETFLNMLTAEPSPGAVSVLSEKCRPNELLRAVNGLFPVVNKKKQSTGLRF